MRGSKFDRFIRHGEMGRIEKLGSVIDAADHGLVPAEVASDVAEVLVSDLLSYKRILASQACWVEWQPFLAALYVPQHLIAHLVG